MRYLLICAALILAACSQAPAENATLPQVERVKAKTYPISESEHVVIIDVPDQYVPRRCMIYANEVTHTSNISCNFDGVGEPFPPAQGE